MSAKQRAFNNFQKLKKSWRHIPEWFYSDGCSCYPEGDRKIACEKHDWKYWLGGTRRDRLNADIELFKNVYALGGWDKWFHSWVMFLGVAIGGKKPFVERKEKLNESMDKLKEIYKRERPEAYNRQNKKSCKRKNKR